MLAAFTFPRTGLEPIDRALDLASKALARLFSDPAADYFDVPQFTVSNGLTVTHGLGRTPTNLITTYRAADVRVWLTGATASTVTLGCNAGGTVALRVW